MKNLLILLAVFLIPAFQSCNNTTGDKASSSNMIDSVSEPEAVAGANNDNPAHDSIDNSNNLIKETEVKGDSHVFMMKAASSGMLEVEGGKLAQAKGVSTQIKRFGAMMVADHTKANHELKVIASEKHVMLPVNLSAEDQKHLNEMKKLSGADFDKHYIQMMAEGHTKVAQLFESESKNSIDKDLKNFAAKTLPVIKMHLDSAKAINSQINKK